MPSIRLTFNAANPAIVYQRNLWTGMSLFYRSLTPTGQFGKDIYVGQVSDGMVFEIPTPPPNTVQTFLVTQYSTGAGGAGTIFTRGPVTLFGTSYSCYVDAPADAEDQRLLYCIFTEVAPTPVAPVLCPSFSINLPAAISAPAGANVGYQCRYARVRVCLQTSAS